MAEYPIFVSRSAYRGSDAKKLAKAAQYNRDVAMIEKHVNDQIKSGKTGVFLYSVIAREVGLPEKRVAEILFSLDCGNRGFTVSTGDHN